MTEHIIRLVDIDDLTTIRVKCNKCKTVFEVAIDKLGDTFSNQQCPKCSAVLGNVRDYHIFAQFEKAVTKLRENENISIEFVVVKPQV